MTRCPQSYCSTWPPRIAVRQSRMSPKAFLCCGESTCPTPENRPRVCGKHRLVRADDRSSLGQKRAGGLDDVQRVQQLRRADRGTYGSVSDMQVASGGFQFRMAEQYLNIAEIDTCFQEVGREGLPQRVRMNRFGDAGGFR